MSYRILPTKEFCKDFKKLDKEMQLRVKKKVEKIAGDYTACESIIDSFQKRACDIVIEGGKVFVLFLIKPLENQ